MSIMTHRPPADYPVGLSSTKVFLGGGISGCPDWQQGVVENLLDWERVLQPLNIDVFNPRRKDYSHSYEAAEKQILWEYQRLQVSDVKVFWFPRETVCPITLFELSRFSVDRKSTLIIGAHPEYTRLWDLKIQMGILGLTVHQTLDDVNSELTNTLCRIRDAKRT